MTTIDDLINSYEVRIERLVEVIKELSDSLRNEIKENARLRAELVAAQREASHRMGQG